MSVPILYVGGVLSELAYSLRVFRAYGIRIWELPFVVMLSLYVHLLETPGMIAALRDEPPPQTVYR